MEGDVTSYPLDSAITSMVGLFSSLHLLAGCQGGGEGEGLMWHDAENLESCGGTWQEETRLNWLKVMQRYPDEQYFQWLVMYVIEH